MNTVFIDPLRCIGCKDCEFACAVAHSASRDPILALAERPAPKPRIHVFAGPWQNSAYPSKCRHCDPAPCVQVCPTGAMGRDDALGLVLVDIGQCISCAMCAIACPFDVVTFYAQANGMPARVVATKCDGCVDRVVAGARPACVEACKVGALVYGDLNELVRLGGQRQSLDVLQAANSQRRAASPQPIDGWQDWGRAAARTAQEVGHGN